MNLKNIIIDGIILFIFLTTLLLNFRFWGGYFESEDLLLALFIIFGILTSSILFALSLFKSERKIKENKYTFGWLIKFNILLFLLLYIVLIIFSFAIVFISVQFFDVQAEVGLIIIIAMIHGLWAIPLVVFLFSIIPSLLFYKFYFVNERLNKKIWQILSSILFILSIFLIIFFVIRVYTCELYKDTVCLANQAIKSGDNSICEKASTKHYNRKDDCYNQISKKLTDVSICDKINSEFSRASCILNIAKNTKNPQLCEMIEIDQVGLNKVTCQIQATAKENKNTPSPESQKIELEREPVITPPDWQTYINEKYDYRLNLFDSGYEAMSNEYATKAEEAITVSIRKADEPLITYQGTTFKPGLDIRISENTNRQTVAESAQASFELNKNNVISSISGITINGVEGKRFNIAGSFSYGGGGSLMPISSIVYFVNNGYIYQLAVTDGNSILGQILNSFEFID